MVVTILVLASVLIGLISFPFMIAGIVFLVQYFARNKTSKIGIILPVVSICVGELFLMPFSVMVAFAQMMHTDWSFRILGVISGIVFIVGLGLLILCAVKAAKNGKVNLGLFIPSLIVFCLGFYMISLCAAIMLLMLLMYSST